MATKTFTFDPDAGVPYGANLSIYGGSDFTANFVVQDINNSSYDLTGYSGSSQMQKGAGIGATTVPAATFTVGFTSAAAGEFDISLGSTQTRNLKEGRYWYDVLVGSGSTIYRIAEGNILVQGGVSSAP